MRSNADVEKIAIAYADYDYAWRTYLSNEREGPGHDLRRKNLIEKIKSCEIYIKQREFPRLYKNIEEAKRHINI